MKIKIKLDMEKKLDNKWIEIISKIALKKLLVI